MGEAFIAARRQLDRAAEMHAEMSRELLEQAKRLHMMKEANAAVCKPKEELLRKLQGQKKDLYNRVSSVCIIHRDKGVKSPYRLVISECQPSTW